MKKANTDLIQKRNEAIYRDFVEMSDVQHLNTEHVLNKLQDRYYLQTETLCKIVRSVNKQRNGY